MGRAKVSQPLCFVLMPYGKKSAQSGKQIDFDAIYQDLIAPAIQDAGLEPLRADQEREGGFIHKPLYERLILCEYALADLTLASPNVFYELGLRHGVRRASTVLLHAEGGLPMPIDVSPLRYLPYRLDVDGQLAHKAADRTALAARLNDARHGVTDSPVYQLVEHFPDIEHIKTDVFRERVAYSEVTKQRLSDARASGVAAVRRFEQGLGPMQDVEAGVVIDLLLSYRAVDAWDDMIECVHRMTGPLAATRMVQEQLAFALNRARRSAEAESVLQALLAKRRTSEAFGLLGRVYKDRWDAAMAAGEADAARGWLEKAIDAYRAGFETDWRDAYPGVNAVTLMEVRQPGDPALHDLLPVVRYAVERRLAAGTPDYWDYATLLELAVLARDETRANAAHGRATVDVRAGWEAKTTARNLRLIREARERRGERLPWAQAIEEALERRAAKV